MIEVVSQPQQSGDLVPLVFIPGITDVIPDDYMQRFTFTTTGESGFFDYHQLDEALAASGFDMILAQPDWSGTPRHQWTEDMIAATRWAAGPGEPVVVGGFSYGGLIAAQVAERLISGGQDAPRVAGVMAVSMSCLFGDWFDEAMRRHPEDKTSMLGKLPNGKSKLYPGAFDELGTVQLPRVECPAQIYIGGEEVPIMKDVAAYAHSHWPQSTLIEIPGGGHSITKAPDLTAIRANIQQLLSETTQ